MEHHPGYLGYGGIIAIHADWPAYPITLGWELALKRLAIFPQTTELYLVDDIDRSILFSSTTTPHKDEFNDTLFYIAIWHEDLITLANKGYISGVTKLNEYEFQIYEHEKFKNNLITSGINIEILENGFKILGQSHPLFVERPMPEDEEESEEWESKNCVRILNALTISYEGWKYLEDSAKVSELDDELFSLVSPFLKIRKFDTAIREAALMIESKIKRFHNNSLFGQQLIKYHIDKIIEKRGHTDAAIKGYRHELRATFKFIRNDFVHNFKVLNYAQTLSILDRMSRLNKEIDEVLTVYFSR